MSKLPELLRYHDGGVFRLKFVKGAAYLAVGRHVVWRGIRLWKAGNDDDVDDIIYVYALGNWFAT